MASLVYHSLSRMAPAYLAAECQVFEEGRRQLHSANSMTRVVRQTYSNFGDRCFPAAGPKLWNSLPGKRTSATNSLSSGWLKTFLFGR